MELINAPQAVYSDPFLVCVVSQLKRAQRALEDAEWDGIDTAFAQREYDHWKSLHDAGVTTYPSF